MAVNPYTLNNLYQNGILDYTPVDLIMGAPVGSVLTPMANPYLNMAQQGALYQNHGAAPDSFHSSFTPAYTPTYYQSVSTPANSYVGAGNFYGYNNGLPNTFNKNEFVTDMPNADKINALGQISDIQNNISNGINKASNAVNSTPKLVLGLLAATIGVIGIAALFKGGKKPASTGSNHSGIWSKLNPVNWFKKNK